MQLFLTNEIQYKRTATVCRRSPIKHTLAASTILVAFVAPAVMAWYLQGSLFFLVVLTLSGILIAWLMIRHIINLFRSGNWTLAIQHDALLINLRSFHNSGFADAKTMLHLPFNEITGGRIHSAKVPTYLSGQKRNSTPSYTTETSLNLQLSDAVDTQDLQTAILEESHRLTPKRMVLGMPMAGRRGHIPVRLIQQKTVRIYWTGPKHGLSPKLEAVIAELSKHIPILPSVATGAIDYNNYSEDAFNEVIVNMVSEGRKMEAIKLMQQRNRSSLNAANREVELLTQRTVER